MTNEAAQTRSLNFLVVEDDKLIGSMVVDALLKSGIARNVIHCLDGEQALEQIRKAWAKDQPPDVIILDVMLPTTDGMEVALTIRKEESASQQAPVPIILLTAVSPTDVRVQSMFQYIQPAQFLHKSSCANSDELIAKVQAKVLESVN